MSSENAQKELNTLKSFRPFAQCFALNVAGEWSMFSSYRNCVAYIRKSRYVSTEILAAQKIEDYQRRGLIKALINQF